MNTLNFPRNQDALRAFFGLGNAQLEFIGTAVPVIDVDFLAKSAKEQQWLTASVVALAPGTANAAQIAMPRRGTFLLDAISFDTTGPATSGVTEFIPSLNLIRAGTVVAAGLVTAPITWTKSAAVTLRYGIQFPKPILLNALTANNAAPTTLNADTVNLTVINQTGSVGNLNATLFALVRELEPIG